jgi:hypothetical protein
LAALFNARKRVAVSELGRVGGEMLRPVYTRSLLLLLLRIWSVNSKWPTRRAAPTFFFLFRFFFFSRSVGDG